MNGNTPNPPSKYRADLLFWSLVIWGLNWLCGAELDQVAWAVLTLEEIEGAKVKEEVGNDAGDICLLLEPSPAHCGGA